MKTIFITGTDTDVGKTFISSLLVKAWDSAYWKPIQTGLESCEADTKIVKNLTGFSEDRFLSPKVELSKPLSPWRAAVQENTYISVSEFEVPQTTAKGVQSLVIEGAGGLFVPINETLITTDLIEALDSPVILVARSGLGTINHTLLSIEHLKQRKIKILGIILNGKPNPDNAAAIKNFANDVPILAQIPEVDVSVDKIENLVDLVPKLESLY